jgi:TPR repeat protein
VRRDNIKLLALARSGDALARCEVGRRYLLGIEGFARHVQSGIEHLTHPAVAALPAAIDTLAHGLALDELLDAGLLPTLRRSAQSGFAPAQSRLGAWLLTRRSGAGEGLSMLRAAAGQGHAPARQALKAWQESSPTQGLGRAVAALLETLQSHGELDAARVALAAAHEALQSSDLACVGAPLSAVLCMSTAQAEAAALLVEVLQAAESSRCQLPHLDLALIEPTLEAQATNGDATAAYALGRALCGIDIGALSSASLVERQNLRKGAALLLRAADGGCEQAWLHLYRVHSDHRASVANPQMARFCLEKAAAGGLPSAQRRLGALLLRSANSLAETERALSWLHLANAGGDGHAPSLLKSLVLPLKGHDAAAEAAVCAIGAVDPWLAARLRIARAFGLTKLEALSFDPVAGLRPWGLVVGRNPFISKIRLSAPRAIPALDARALEQLRAVVALYSQAGPDAASHEGDLRRRSMNQRRLFARFGVDEAMFFAAASSTALDALRLGSKWAFRMGRPLQLALAD